MSHKLFHIFRSSRVQALLITGAFFGGIQNFATAQDALPENAPGATTAQAKKQSAAPATTSQDAKMILSHESQEIYQLGKNETLLKANYGAGHTFLKIASGQDEYFIVDGKRFGPFREIFHERLFDQIVYHPGNSFEKWCLRINDQKGVYVVTSEEKTFGPYKHLHFHHNACEGTPESWSHVTTKQGQDYIYVLGNLYGPYEEITSLQWSERLDQLQFYYLEKGAGRFVSHTLPYHESAPFDVELIKDERVKEHYRNQSIENRYVRSIVKKHHMLHIASANQKEWMTSARHKGRCTYEISGKLYGPHKKCSGFTFTDDPETGRFEWEFLYQKENQFYRVANDQTSGPYHSLYEKYRLPSKTLQGAYEYFYRKDDHIFGPFANRPTAPSSNYIETAPTEKKIFFLIYTPFGKKESYIHINGSDYGPYDQSRPFHHIRFFQRTDQDKSVWAFVGYTSSGWKIVTHKERVKLPAKVEQVSHITLGPEEFAHSYFKNKKWYFTHKNKSYGPFDKIKRITYIQEMTVIATKRNGKNEEYYIYQNGQLNGPFERAAILEGYVKKTRFISTPTPRGVFYQKEGRSFFIIDQVSYGPFDDINSWPYPLRVFNIHRDQWSLTIYQNKKPHLLTSQGLYGPFDRSPGGEPGTNWGENTLVWLFGFSHQKNASNMSVSYQNRPADLLIYPHSRKNFFGEQMRYSFNFFDLFYYKSEKLKTAKVKTISLQIEGQKFNDLFFDPKYPLYASPLFYYNEHTLRWFGIKENRVFLHQLKLDREAQNPNKH